MRTCDGPDAIGSALDAAHVDAGLDVTDGIRERVGQRLHAAAERKAACRVLRLPGGLPAFPRAENLTFDEAAVFLLQCMQPRKRRGDRDPFRIARIDTRHEWIDRVIEELGAETAAHKPGDRFVRAGGRGFHERLAK